MFEGQKEFDISEDMTSEYYHIMKSWDIHPDSRFSTTKLRNNAEAKLKSILRRNNRISAFKIVDYKEISYYLLLQAGNYHSGQLQINEMPNETTLTWLDETNPLSAKIDLRRIDGNPMKIKEKFLSYDKSTTPFRSSDDILDLNQIFDPQLKMVGLMTLLDKISNRIIKEHQRLRKDNKNFDLAGFKVQHVIIRLCKFIDALGGFLYDDYERILSKKKDNLGMMELSEMIEKWRETRRGDAFMDMVKMLEEENPELKELRLGKKNKAKKKENDLWEI